jgi:hypothetical protein
VLASPASSGPADASGETADSNAIDGKTNERVPSTHPLAIIFKVPFLKKKQKFKIHMKNYKIHHFLAAEKKPKDYGRCFL